MTATAMGGVPVFKDAGKGRVETREGGLVRPVLLRHQGCRRKQA